MTKDEALDLALEALEEIALAGMSGTGQESDEAMTNWHARQAWKFIGIAARALEPIKQARSAPVQEPEIVQRVKRYAGQTMRTARNPNITARECIELANWIVATPSAQPAPDLQAELEATNRQVEILSDALAESRREIAQLKAQPAVPDAFGTREGEHPQYIQGWNDCRAEMLREFKEKQA